MNACHITIHVHCNTIQDKGIPLPPPHKPLKLYQNSICTCLQWGSILPDQQLKSHKTPSNTSIILNLETYIVLESKNDLPIANLCLYAPRKLTKSHILA